MNEISAALIKTFYAHWPYICVGYVITVYIVHGIVAAGRNNG